MEGDGGALLRGQQVERVCQVKPRLARHLTLAAAEAAKALGKRLEAMAPAVGRDPFIHGDSCQPRSWVFVAQTADPLPGLEKRLLDGILGQGLIAQNQSSRSEQLETVTVHHLLEGVTVAFSPASDDAPERGIHEHANGMTTRESKTGEPSPATRGRGFGRTVIISSRIASCRRWPAPRSGRAARQSRRR